MKNCARCYEELATLSDEVDVRFIALLSLFDRAPAHKAPFAEKKPGQVA